MSITLAKRGLIVKKEWILDCYVKKKRLPAKLYRLSGGAGDTSSSEDDWYDTRDKKTGLGKAGGQRSSVAEAGIADKTEDAPGEGQRSGDAPGAGGDQRSDETNKTGDVTGGGERSSEAKMEEDPYEASTDEEPIAEDEGEP